MKSSRTPRAALCFVIFLAAALLFFAISNHGRTRTLPAGLRAFQLDDPPPKCASSKTTMPRYRDPGHFRIYMRGRALLRSKIEIDLNKVEAASILRDVQSAAEGGDWGARALMSHFYLYGLGRYENRVLDPMPHKSIEILRLAVEAGQAWAHYDLGVAYERGYGGVPHDTRTAWAYYLRAAELGSPHAQMALSNAYLEDERWEASEHILDCAYRQGHGEAAHQLGINHKIQGDFAVALQYYQAGVKFGYEESADSLMLFFDPETWKNRPKEEQDLLRRLNLKPDEQRYHGYEKIAAVLRVNPDLRLSSLDKILPLPPAELPPWPGVEVAIEAPNFLQPNY